MILRIGYIEISHRIQRHAPGVAEPPWLRARPADDFNRLIVQIKNLDPAVAKLAHILPPRRIHGYVVRITQLPVGGTRFAVSPNELASAVKNLNAMITRIRHVHPLLRIHTQAFGPIEFTWSRAGMPKTGKE